MVKKSFLFLLVIMSLFVFPLFAEDITTGWIEGQILATDDIDGLIRQTTRTLLDGMRVRRRGGA